MTTGNIRLAQVLRAGTVESVHDGAVVVADAHGQIVQAWGDPDLVTYPRSALKPFQAVGLVESGALDAMGLDDRFLALACASHRAEPAQVELATRWLGLLGLDEQSLVCGPDLPRDRDSAEAILRSGGTRRRIFHNCSGKHCGYLTLARHRGWPLDGYERDDHPGQQLFLSLMQDLSGRGPSHRWPTGIDGCGLPAIAMPLAEMARTAARFAARRAQGERRQQAIGRILEAMARHPDLISGAGQPVEQIVRACGGRVVLKGGAEAFLVGFVPERGWGIAMKIADGNSRGRMQAFVEVLRCLGVIDAALAGRLQDELPGSILNSNGLEVGRVEAVPLQ
jgi:L-asparaginase II